MKINNIMEHKYLITTKSCFYTKDGSLKSACWGRIKHEDSVVMVGDELKGISFNDDNVLTILRCDEKPIELCELGFPQTVEYLLNIYIAE